MADNAHDLFDQKKSDQQKDQSKDQGRQSVEKGREDSGQDTGCLLHLSTDGVRHGLYRRGLLRCRGNGGGGLGEEWDMHQYDQLLV